MKKKQFIIIIVLFFLFALILIDYYKTKRTFYNRLHGISLEIETGSLLRSKLIDYYYKYGQFPNDIKEIDSLFFNPRFLSKKDLIYARKRSLMDPFTRNKSYYYYKPMFDKNTLLREGYVILSRGIDGKINNHFKDTIYLKDNLHLKVYNDSILKNNYHKLKFNYIDKYLGKKDYLLNPYYLTGRKLLKMNTCGCISIKQLIKNMKKDYCWKVTCLKCAKNNITLKNDDIIYREEGINVLISFKDKISRQNLSDTVNIIGIVKDKIKNKNIEIHSAFILYTK